jgi:hypothetical protein
MSVKNKNKQKIPWFQSAKQIIPTERPPLVGEFSANFSGIGYRVVSATNPHGR